MTYPIQAGYQNRKARRAAEAVWRRAPKKQRKEKPLTYAEYLTKVMHPAARTDQFAGVELVREGGKIVGVSVDGVKQ